MLADCYKALGGEWISRQSLLGTFSAVRFGPANGEQGVVPEGKTVICLHGFPDTIYTYQHQVPVLVEAGYQVIIPVMRGYESGSVQSDNHYFLNQLAQDVVDWMDWLALPRAHIVGHDWGAASAWVCAALAPDRIVSLTSIAIPPLGRLQQSVSAVPSQLLYSWYMGFFQLGGISDWVVEANDWQFIRYLWRRWSPGYEDTDNAITEVVSALSEPGVKQATLQYYRCLRDVRNVHWKASQRLVRSLATGKKVTVPTHIIFGKNDGCMSEKIFAASVRPADFSQGVKVSPITGAGHFVQREDPASVNPLLLTFMASV